jgi:cytochrome P450
LKLFVKRAIRYLVVRLLLGREWIESRATYYPLSAKLHSDPYPSYRKLRRHSPVHRSRLLDGWVLSAHEDVDRVLRDYKRFSNDQRNTRRRPRFEAYAAETRSLLRLDPPDHTRLRSLVGQAFTPRAVEQLRPRVEGIVDGLLEEIGDTDRFDAIADLAYPLSVTVIAEMVGVPPEDRDQFRIWSGDVARVLEPATSLEEARRSLRSRSALSEYFNEIVARRQVEPRDDLISALIAAEDNGDKLTRDETLATLVLLLVAGIETTQNLIGNGLLALLRHPDQLQRLRECPEMIESAIDELLRFDSPVQIDSRTALEDMEIGGRRIRKGQQIVLLIGAANRDPEVFADPDRLDLGRETQSHISFGRGIHHCLGSPLARIEGQVAFRKLLERYSEIRLGGEPRFKDHVVLRGLRSLPLIVERSKGVGQTAGAAGSRVLP